MLNLQTKLVFDNDVISKNSNLFKAFGGKALIVTGRSSSKNGSLSDVESVLRNQNISYDIYDEVEANPSVETVMKARDIGIKSAANFVIGIGGGSPMDAAKAVAVMIKNKNSGEEFLYDSTKNTSAVPIVEVPTTCGSGAEVTPNAVLTVHKDKTKKSSVHRVYPELALVDPKYILNAPSELISSTALDALTHLIESFVNTKANKYTKLICINGMMLWSRCKKVILGKEKLSSEVCGDLMLASTLAGMAISHTGTSIPHRLSYNLTYDSHVSHGRAVAYFTPGFLRFCDKKDVKMILNLIQFKTVDDVEKFIRKLIGRVNGSIATFDRSIEEILDNKKVLSSVRFSIDKKRLMEICGI